MSVKLRLAPFRGSHLPLLMQAVSRTTGPILELGCGLYSTTPLHWACFVPKRKLVTYENNPEYYDFLKAYATDFHEVHCISDWDSIDIEKPWSVAFVDHEPCHPGERDRRFREVQRLVQHAEYVVVHDTERRNEQRHRISEMNALFKYRFWFRDARPNTTVYSNVHDLTDFLGRHRGRSVERRIEMLDVTVERIGSTECSHDWRYRLEYDDYVVRTCTKCERAEEASQFKALDDDEWRDCVLELVDPRA